MACDEGKKTPGIALPKLTQELSHLCWLAQPFLIFIRALGLHPGSQACTWPSYVGYSGFHGFAFMASHCTQGLHTWFTLYTGFTHMGLHCTHGFTLYTWVYTHGFIHMDLHGKQGKQGLEMMGLHRQGLHVWELHLHCITCTFRFMHSLTH